MVDRGRTYATAFVTPYTVYERFDYPGQPGTRPGHRTVGLMWPGMTLHIATDDRDGGIIAAASALRDQLDHIIADAQARIAREALPDVPLAAPLIAGVR